MPDPTQQLDTPDILKTSEIHPHDLTRVHLPLKVKRPFLGLVPTGHKAKIAFQAKHTPNDMRVLLVKPRGYELARLSHKLIQFDPNLTEDSVEVEQADASAEPSLTVHIDYYSTGLDFCKNKVGHNPTCQHYMGSVTLHYSLAYARFLAALAAVGMPLKWLQEKLVVAREAVRLRAYTTYIIVLRTLRRLKNVPSTMKEKLIPGLATVRSRGLRLNPLIYGIAILVLGVATLLLASIGNFSMPSFASSEPAMQSEPSVQPRMLATRYELRCRGKLKQVGTNTLEETDCIITGLDGEPPDELTCENDYQVVKTPTGLELIGCKGIWYDPPHQS